MRVSKGDPRGWVGWGWGWQSKAACPQTPPEFLQFFYKVLHFQEYNSITKIEEEQHQLTIENAAILLIAAAFVFMQICRSK